jgi:Glycolipid transfer protein (GLTP)
MIRVQSLARGSCRRMPLDNEDEERTFAVALRLGASADHTTTSRNLWMSANKRRVEQCNEISAMASSSNLDESANEIILSCSEDSMPSLPVFSKLAAMFQKVVVYNDEGAIQDLAFEPLLSACWAFEAQMQRLNCTAVAKDFSQNIRKVLSLLEKESIPASVKSVSCLLAFEKQKVGHLYCHNTEGPCRHGITVQLRDPSAAMGLLWIRRNLAFQYQMYRRTFSHSESKEKPPVAALAAYRQELEPHYGNNWMLRRFVQLGCHVFIPSSARVFLAKLNGYDPRTMSEEQERHARQGMEFFLKVVGPILESWNEIFRDLGLEVSP